MPSNDLRYQSGELLPHPDDSILGTVRKLVKALLAPGAVNYYSSVTSLSGFADVPTASLSVPVIAQIVVDGQLLGYQLLAKTVEVPDGSNVIEPSDYNLATNNKVWVRVL